MKKQAKKAAPARVYDATTEFKPFERDPNYNGRHPRGRWLATKAKRLGVPRRDLVAAAKARAKSVEDKPLATD